MTESSESGAGKIALKIKTTAVQYDVEVPEGATVGDVSGLNSVCKTPKFGGKKRLFFLILETSSNDDVAHSSIFPFNYCENHHSEQCI